MSSMLQTHYAKGEIAQRGQAVYEQQIRHKVETEHHGKFLVVDIETSDYEIDTEVIPASRRIRARHPDAVLYIMRIGYHAAYVL
jgi:hypothetical protein